MLAETLLGAVNVGAELIDVGGVPYAALCDHGRWNVWNLSSIDAPIYYCDDQLHSCTCPAPGICKHLKALREAHPVKRSRLDPTRGR